MKVGKVLDGVANAAINVTATGAGATVAAYVINHDACNDQDLSLIVGAGSGVATFCVTRSIMRSIKDGTVSTCNKVKTKLSRKAKKSSTT